MRQLYLYVYYAVLWLLIKQKSTGPKILYSQRIYRYAGDISGFAGYTPQFPQVLQQDSIFYNKTIRLSQSEASSPHFTAVPAKRSEITDHPQYSYINNVYPELMA